MNTTTLDLMDIADASSRLARRLDLMGFSDDVIGLHAYSYGGTVRVAVHARTFAATNRIATYLGARTAENVNGTFIYDWTKVVGSPFSVQVYGPAAD